MVRTTVACVGLIGVGLLAACGSSSTTTPPPTTLATAAPTVAAPTPTSTAPPTTAPAATVDLSGAWTGQYSGPFNGTFTLQWNQTGSKVNGTINLSSPADNLSIDGTLSGATISFGAVGVVTYTGTVSGNSMNGSYTDVANGQMGSWSATKS